MSKRPSARFNDPGYYYDQRKLLIWFTLSSAAMMAGILWLIWDDFDRPWKEEQRQQMKWEASKSALEHLILETRTWQIRSRLAKERAGALAKIEAREEDLKKVRDELPRARGAFAYVDMRYKEQKQYVTQAEYHVHEARTEAERKRWVATLKRVRDQEHRLRDAVQDAAAERDRLVAVEKEIAEDLDAVLEKERSEPELKRMRLLEAAIERKRGFNPLRNLPLLDFLAPPTKVEQVVLDNLVDNYEFSTPKKVDRCGTCHVGVMRAGFGGAMWPVEVLDMPAGPERTGKLEEAVYRFVFSVLDRVTPKPPSRDPYPYERNLLRTLNIHHETLKLLFADYDEEEGEIGLDGKERKVWRRWSKNEKGRWVSGKEGRSMDERFAALLQRMRGHWRTHPHLGDMVGSSSPHPYDRFGCTVCHQGRGWSVDFGLANHTPDRVRVDDWMTSERAHEEGRHLPLNAKLTLEEAMAKGNPEGNAVHTGWVTDEETGHDWEENLGWIESKRHSWHWPQLPRMLVQSSCLKCHREGLYRSPEVEYPEGTHLGEPDPGLPDTRAWSIHAREFNDDEEAEESGAYLGRIFVPRKGNPYRPVDLERGLDNFLRFGCYGCHKIDPKVYPFMNAVRPKVGPQLDDIARKTTRRFLQRWVLNPKEFRPRTRMPRFFGLSNNSHEFQFRFADGGYDSVKGVEWSRAEVYCIVEWLLDESRKGAYPEVDLSRGDPKRGERIVTGDYYASDGKTPIGAARACTACHDVPVSDPQLAYDKERIARWTERGTGRVFGWRDRMSRRQGPDLKGIGSKVNAGWLVAWLKDPRGYWHETNMPDLRLTDRDALDVAAYLMTLEDATLEKATEMGPNHPVIEKIAQELKVAEQQESTSAAIAIVARWSKSERALYVGRKLVKHHGCFGCHTISEYKDETPIGTELTGWGSKLIARLEFNHAPIEHTHFDFAYTKLMNPRIYDHGMPRRDSPLERLRMPRFGLTSEEAKAIAVFLVGLVNDPIPDASLFRPDARREAILRGRQVVRRYNCRGCHIIEGRGGDVWGAVKKDKWKPPDLLGQGLKTNPQWLFRFLKDPAFVAIPGEAGTDRVRPWHSIRMPTFGLDDEEARALVRYFAALSNAPADFEDPGADSLSGPGAQYAAPRTLEVPDPGNPGTSMRITVRNARQEALALFKALQCKSCHSSDPSVPIGNRAPDFRHARGGRLREAWMELWLWGPSKLQKGTAMPTFFEEEDDRGRMVPKVEYEAFFGADAARQIRALRDHVRHHYREAD